MVIPISQVSSGLPCNSLARQVLGLDALLAMDSPARCRYCRANARFRSAMRSLLVRRRAVRSVFPITFAVCCGVALAQAPRDCHGQVDIEGALAKQPAAEAYNALGAWFARHSQVTCA